jgi:hypothetical protein
MVKENLRVAQSRQKSYVDHRRRELSFEVGDFVYLKVSPMYMAGIHMVEGVRMVEERLLKEWPEVEGIDTEEERPPKECSEVKGMDMVEDMMAAVDEREHDAVVLARHWISDGAERHWRSHREREELAKSRS